MKIIYLFASIVLLSMNSCMYQKDFGKRPLFLVGADKDIEVKHNGKKVQVTCYTMGVASTDYNGYHTYYCHPAVLIRVRRNNQLVFTSKGKMTSLNIKGKYGKGVLFLVLETPFTFGIGTLVDLATRSFYYPESKYIDIEAAFNRTAPRSDEELKYTAREHSIIR